MHIRFRTFDGYQQHEWLDCMRVSTLSFAKAGSEVRLPCLHTSAAQAEECDTRLTARWAHNASALFVQVEAIRSIQLRTPMLHAFFFWFECCARTLCGAHARCDYVNHKFSEKLGASLDDQSYLPAGVYKKMGYYGLQLQIKIIADSPTEHALQMLSQLKPHRLMQSIAQRQTGTTDVALIWMRDTTSHAKLLHPPCDG